MNLNGIGAPYGSRGIAPLRDEARTRPETGEPRSTGLPPAAPAPVRTPAEAPGSAAVPVEPPAGTDPELWSVLTAEERAFFAKAGAMGPLTYGRIMISGAPQPPAVRGGRLDVRA